jgi:DNA-binding transcriptional LysR family regulator
LAACGSDDGCCGPLLNSKDWDEALILWQTGLDFLYIFEGILSAQGIAPPVSQNSRSMESLRSEVSNGLGFSLSGMKLDHGNAGGRVVSVPIADDIDRLQPSCCANRRPRSHSK